MAPDAARSLWGPARYGDPCDECGFTWSVGVDDAVAGVRQVPRAYAALLSGTSGTERAEAGAWTTAGYVCHVADNLRIWAERLAGAAAGAGSAVAGYDQDALAAARRYDAVPLEAALWSLGRAVDDWCEAVDAAAAAHVVLVHEVWGELGVRRVVLANAHDAVHHGWDLRRAVGERD